MGAGERAQQLQVLAAKPDNLSSVPKVYRMGGKNGVPEVVL